MATPATTPQTHPGIPALREGFVGSAAAMFGRGAGASSTDARGFSTRRLMRSTNWAVGAPSARRVHCTRMNSSGTRALDSRVWSITIGMRKGIPAAMSWVRSIASFHSRRKYPSPRAWLFAEIIATKSAHSLICLLIFASHASPPRSSLWSNQTSIPNPCRASAMRRAASVSSRA